MWNASVPLPVPICFLKEKLRLGNVFPKVIQWASLGMWMRTLFSWDQPSATLLPSAYTGEARARTPTLPSGQCQVPPPS